MGNRDAVGLAGTRALQFAKRAAFRKAFHMVVAVSYTHLTLPTIA